MSTGELFLTFLVALVVLGPKKLPMLARDAGVLLARLNRYKQHAITIWQSQMKQCQLEENIRKAETAAINEEK